jgi:hypothetical protein
MYEFKSETDFLIWIFQCRENLKWTYVYAFYMFDQIQNPNILQGFKEPKKHERMRALNRERENNLYLFEILSETFIGI